MNMASIKSSIVLIRRISLKFENFFLRQLKLKAFKAINLIAFGILLNLTNLATESKWLYPIKLSSPPSPVKATVTYGFVTEFSNNEGSAELSANGSSYTSTNLGIKAITSLGLQMVVVCFDPI